MDKRTQVGQEQLVSWADRLQAMARTGLFFAGNEYDRERYQAIIGVAAEMAGLLTDRPPLDVQAIWSGDIGYVTPGVGVGAAIFNEDGEILLLQRPEPRDGRPYWGLPVGWSEVGETAAQGIAREVREETGLIVRVDRLLGVYDCRGPLLLHHAYSISFFCTVVAGVLTPTPEAPVGSYVARDALPLLLPHHVTMVADAFAAYDGTRAEATFDR